MEFITYGGESLGIILPDPDWIEDIALTLALSSEILEGRSGRESRLPGQEDFSVKQECRFWLEEDEADDFRYFIAQLESQRVLIPIYADKLEVDEWSDRIFEGQYVLNFDETGYAIYQKDAIPGKPAYQFLAPLLKGYVTEPPTERALHTEGIEFVFTVAEDSPWEWRIDPVTATVGSSWPSDLEIDWAVLPTETSEDRRKRKSYGVGREAGIEDDLAPRRWAQKGMITLDDRDQMRTLLNFWLAREGTKGAFDMDMLLQPGPDRSETPHNTKFRFAADYIKLSFSTLDDAETTLAFLQVPWEIDPPVGETPEQPLQAYLYHFLLHVPGGPVEWHQTNYRRSLNMGGNDYNPRQLKHDKITGDIKLKSNTTIESHYYADNPLLRLIPWGLEGPLELYIYNVEVSDPDGTKDELFRGWCHRAKPNGKIITAKFDALGGLLDQQLGHFVYGANCNATFCDALCQLDIEDWTFGANYVGHSGNDLTVSITSNPPGHTLSNNYFADGTVSKGAGATYEERPIAGSEDLGGGQQKVTLMIPFTAAQAGDSYDIIPECHRTTADCSKYDNRINFQGHEDMPTENPSIPKIETNQDASKK